MVEHGEKEIFDQIEKKHLCKKCPEMFDSEQEAYQHVRDEHYS